MGFSVLKPAKIHLVDGYVYIYFYININIYIYIVEEKYIEVQKYL